MKVLLLYYFLLFILIFYGNADLKAQNSFQNIDISGMTVSTRILPPVDFIRPPFPTGSFQSHLSSIPINNADAKVIQYDGYEKLFECYTAVINMDFDNSQDMIHGEHIIEFLRAEFLFKSAKFDMIRFTFDDNRSISFDQWGAGARFVWIDSLYVLDTIAPVNYSEESFTKFMNLVVKNTTTNSLNMDTKIISKSQLSVGDILVQPSDKLSPGHAIMIIDMVVNPKTGEKLVLLAQGYNPTQSVHILKNTLDSSISPWYSISDESPFFTTAQWTFRPKHIRRFRINANALSIISAYKDVSE